MKKIMFICTGNTCRSAMAEAMLAKKTKERNLDVDIYSAGIYAQNGDGPTMTAISVMEDRGIDMSAHRATNIAQSNIKNMDLILCATMAHKYQLIQLYPELKDKIYTIKEYTLENSETLDISDPWGTNKASYEKCAQEIELCIDKLIEKI